MTFTFAIELDFSRRFRRPKSTTKTGKRPRKTDPQKREYVEKLLARMARSKGVAR